MTRRDDDRPPPSPLPDPDAVRPYLAAALAWLYDVEQPADALISHHGVGVTAAHLNRHYSVSAVAAQSRPVLVVKVADARWNAGRGWYDKPLHPAELEMTSALLEELGASVRDTWNGHPADQGSIGLIRAPHPGLVAAQRRYSDGCRAHADRGVFCGCGWYGEGEDRLVKPPWPEVAPAQAQDPL